MRPVALALLLIVGACDRIPSAVNPAAVGQVILVQDGDEMKSVPVGKLGAYCWVARYEGIEKVVLRSDGTAEDMSIRYTWTLDTPGPDDRKADAAWFHKNCRDLPNIETDN